MREQAYDADPVAGAGMTRKVGTSGTFAGRHRPPAGRAILAICERHRIAGPVRVRLSGDGPDSPVVVQVNLLIGGTPARVQLSGAAHEQAVNAAARRLDRHIIELFAGRHMAVWPDRRRRPLATPVSGEIVRVKTVPLAICPPNAAAAVLYAMDYDAHLFTDAETGEDAVIYRSGPTGLRLDRQISTRPPHDWPASLTINPRTAATLTPAESAARLIEGWLPFLFFTDRDTGRGNLLYRRHDMHLALIQPEPTIQP